MCSPAIALTVHVKAGRCDRCALDSHAVNANTERRSCSRAASGIVPHCQSNQSNQSARLSRHAQMIASL